ncbi:SDR family NAD(P)-dependent oxidoreductase [Xylophilus sp.]|uniref:SDR family NAD(P)-dependent oxidoreductase n=1 Tax=Xylophilus sp. TaxID=2653893 RepID=UPI0013B92BC0|nr:SDR family NAD(P)-dependent oxidoreductase [Xylophilus sp.]KAF1044214.1 MAG: putative short-chain type dehydrogenase/reductase [Xylophilus sp.]
MGTQNSLEGKVIVVTGAGGGVGKAVALLAAAQGARVVVNDLGVSLGGDKDAQSPAAAVVAEIEAAGGQAVASEDSVAQWDSARRIIEQAVSTFGRINAVVNSAGILRDAIFHKLEPADFESVLQVHLFGAYNTSRAAAAHFREQGSGALVHMTSTAGLIGSIGQANYAAAKLGIVGLSRSISLDMARFGVRSNCIAPHAFSRMIESVPGLSPEEQERYLEKRRQTTRPDQIAPLAVLLCSDAAKDITGQIFGARGNEVYLYSQPRPIRTLHRGEGWTPQTLAEQLVPAWRSSFTPAERTRDVFGWEAI